MHIDLLVRKGTMHNVLFLRPAPPFFKWKNRLLADPTRVRNLKVWSLTLEWNIDVSLLQPVKEALVCWSFGLRKSGQTGLWQLPSAVQSRTQEPGLVARNSQEPGGLTESSRGQTSHYAEVGRWAGTLQPGFGHSVSRVDGDNSWLVAVVQEHLFVSRVRRVEGPVTEPSSGWMWDQVRKCLQKAVIFQPGGRKGRRWAGAPGWPALV